MRDKPSILLSDNAASALLGISRATLWRHVAAQILPKPIRLGGRTLWRRDELLAAIEQAAAQRDGGAV